jgi:glycosyltransferase 2 family protein
LKRFAQISISLLLAGVVMYCLYRDFPFQAVGDTLTHDINWLWVAAGMVAAAMAQLARAVRWSLLLSPLGARCGLRNLSAAVFTSFALSLVIPRIGEISRCATLRKTDGVTFSGSIGTVVAERIADTLALLALFVVVFCTQGDKVRAFLPSSVSETAGGNVTTIAAVAALAAAVAALCVWKFRNNEALRSTLSKFKAGLLSVAHCGHPWLFVLHTVLISFFNLLNLWLMLFAFPLSSGLGAGAPLLAFSIITFAMVIPTPNGAGPWHYVVMTSLVLYGVDKTDASAFALIVHALNTLTIILLGLAGMLMLRRRTAVHS